MQDIDTTKFSPELRKALAWFSTAYCRLKERERPGASIPRFVDVDYITSRDTLIRFQSEWPLLADLDLPKRGDEITERMSKDGASRDEIGQALDNLVPEVRNLEKELSDLGSKIAKEK